MTMTTSTTGGYVMPARLRALGTVADARTTAWPVTFEPCSASYVRRDLVPTHSNSIALSGVVAPVPAGRDGSAAKQAAPPRGVPR